MSNADDDSVMAEFIDESKLDVSGQTSFVGYGTSRPTHGDGNDTESNVGGASVSGYGPELSRATQRWMARVVNQLARAFYKSPFALPNAVAGLADIRTLCEESAFESIEEFSREVKDVLQRWASGAQSVDADQKVRQQVMTDARRAVDVFDQLMNEDPSKLPREPVGSARSARDSMEPRYSEPPETKAPQNNGKRKTSAAEIPDTQWDRPKLGRTNDEYEMNYNQPKGGNDWGDQSVDQDEDEDEDEGDFDEDDTRSPAGLEEESTSSQDHDEDSSDEFTLQKRPTRQRKPPTEVTTAATAASSTAFLNTSEGTLHRRFSAHVLNELFKKKHYNFTLWFTEPVDTTLVPDYLSVVAEPMDLSTIKKKWHQGYYDKSVNLFESDILLMLRNCYAYNGVGSDVSECGKKLENLFEEQMARKEDFFADPASPDFTSTSSDPKFNKVKPKVSAGGTPTGGKSGSKSHSVPRFDWDSAIKACEQCGTKSSPEWRRVVMDESGPNGEEVIKMLCNACGLRIVRARRKAAQTSRKGKTTGTHFSASQLVPTGHYTGSTPPSTSHRESASHGGLSGVSGLGASNTRESTPTVSNRKPKQPRPPTPPPPLPEELGDRKAKKMAVVAVASTNRPQSLTAPDVPAPRRRDDYDMDSNDPSQRPYSGTSTRPKPPPSGHRKVAGGSLLGGGADQNRRPQSAMGGSIQNGANGLPRINVNKKGGDQQMAGKKRKIDSMDDGGDYMDTTPESEMPGRGSSALEYATLSHRLRELERQNMVFQRERAEIRLLLEEKTRSSNALRGEVTIMGGQLAEKSLQLDQIRQQLREGMPNKKVMEEAEELAAKIAIVAEIATQRQVEEKLLEEFEAKYRSEMSELSDKAAKFENDNKDLARQANEKQVLLTEAIARADQFRHEVEVLSVDVAAGGTAAASAKLIEMLRKERFEAQTEADTLRAALAETTKEVYELQVKLKSRPVAAAPAQPPAAATDPNADPLTAVTTTGETAAAAPMDADAVEQKDIVEQHESIIRDWKEARGLLEGVEKERDRLKSLLKAKMTETEDMARKVKERDVEKAKLESEVARLNGKLASIRTNLAAVRAAGLASGEASDEVTPPQVTEQVSVETLSGLQTREDSMEASVDEMDVII